MSNQISARRNSQGIVKNQPAANSMRSRAKSFCDLNRAAEDDNDGDDGVTAAVGQDSLNAMEDNGIDIVPADAENNSMDVLGSNANSSSTNTSAQAEVGHGEEQTAETSDRSDHNMCAKSSANGQKRAMPLLLPIVKRRKQSMVKTIILNVLANKSNGMTFMRIINIL